MHHKRNPNEICLFYYFTCYHISDAFNLIRRKFRKICSYIYLSKLLYWYDDITDVYMHIYFYARHILKKPFTIIQKKKSKK